MGSLESWPWVWRTARSSSETNRQHGTRPGARRCTTPWSRRPAKPGNSCAWSGTLAPGAEDGWWRALIAAGSRPGVYVQTLQANPDKALSWREVLRVNPVSQVNATLRVALRREFDEAKHDSRSRARINSYRLNLPSAETSTVVLSVAEWKGALDRPVPPRAGRPVVGVDLGGGRAWSAAVALWPNGRTEAMAIAPGSVAIEGQEKRDRVPRGTYARLLTRRC